MSCQFCNRNLPVTFHHLIPRTLHTNKWFQKNFSKTEMKDRGVNLCRDCHDFIHKQWDEKYLGRNLNTIELLLEQECVKKFISFIKKQRIHNG